MASTEKRQHFLAGKTIFVVGGGIAGLSFAVGIQKHWDSDLKPPTIVIYDRDNPDSAAWREGENYTFSISGYNDAGGLVALKRLGLLDHVFSSAVSGLDGSGAFKIWGPDWTERLCSRRAPVAGLPTPSIRIVRKELRRILIDAVDSCPDSSIEWNYQCINVEKTQNSRLRVHFKNSQKGSGQVNAECDLLIAADGANSKLRALLRPNDELEHIGAVLRGGLATFPDGVPSPINKDWGFIMSNIGVSCFLSPVDRNTVIWAVGNLEDQPTKELTHKSTQEDRRVVIDQGAKLGSIFQEPFPAMARQTDPKSAMCINARDKQPFRHDAIADTPVIFIGDSNHALSPFAGFGANLALSDAFDLADQLCHSHESLAKAVEAYDQISEPRARKMWLGSRKNVKAGHSTGVRYWVFMSVLFIGSWLSWIIGIIRG